MLAAKGDALAGLWIEGQKYFADGLKGEAWEQDDFQEGGMGSPLPDSLWRSRNLWGAGPKNGRTPQ